MRVLLAIGTSLQREIEARLDTTEPMTRDDASLKLDLYGKVSEHNRMIWMQNFWLGSQNRGISRFVRMRKISMG